MGTPNRKLSVNLADKVHPRQTWTGGAKLDSDTTSSRSAGFSRKRLYRCQRLWKVCAAKAPLGAISICRIGDYYGTPGWQVSNGSLAKERTSCSRHPWAGWFRQRAPTPWESVYRCRSADGPTWDSPVPGRSPPAANLTPECGLFCASDASSEKCRCGILTAVD